MTKMFGDLQNQVQLHPSFSLLYTFKQQPFTPERDAQHVPNHNTFIILHPKLLLIFLPFPVPP